MKQILLVFTLLISVTLVAGNLNTNKEKIKNEKIRKVNALDKAYGDDIAASSKTENTVVARALNLKAPAGDVVGTTTYDLQTNSGMCRRVATHPSGRWSYFGWTQGKDYTVGAANRGTGFNYYDRNSGIYQEQPTRRVEPMERVGWPTIGFNQGRQFSITHTGAAGMMFAYRAGTAGSELDTWTEIIVGNEVNDPSGVWARAAADGSNIYAVISRQSGGDAAAEPFGNILGGLNFIRSTDNGDTWESTGPLEADYSNSYPVNMSADSYQIDAAGDRVCVVFGSGLGSLTLYSSDDNGVSFSKQIIAASSNPLARNLGTPEAPDFTVDPYFATDGGQSVVIDSNGKAHIVYSARIGFNTFDNDHAAEGAFFIFRETATMFYWNEDLEEPVNIGKANLYDDGDGTLGTTVLNSIAAGFDENNGLDRYPFYSNMIGQPTLGIDREDNLYLSYTSAVDGHFAPDSIGYTTRVSIDGMDVDTTLYAQFPSNSILMNDVFMLKSTDGGSSWQGPLNVTNAASEEVYPSIARNIRDTIMLLYQHDELPGTLLQGPQANATVNEMAVVKILPDEINDEAAPADSEPMLAVFSTSYILPVNCSIDKDLFLINNSWVIDYPEGLVEPNIKIWEGDGVPDFSVPDTLIVGIYAEDAAGNQSDTIQVSVIMIPDDVAPAIEIDNECSEFDILVGSEWTTPDVNIFDLVEFTNGDVTSIEDSGCDISESLTVIDTVDPTTPGAYTVTYTATDFSGNEGSLVLNVNVIEADVTPPVIETANVPEEIGLDQAINTDTWMFIGKDNVDCTDVTVDVQGIDEIDPGTIGEYKITVTATDKAGNATTEVYTVNVVDTQAPEIQIIGDYSIIITDSSTCGDDGIFDDNDDPGITATDNVEGELDIEIIYNYGDGIDCSVEGLYFIEYIVTDAAGNVAEAGRSVEVDIDTSIENPIYDFVDIFPNPTKGMLTVEAQNLIINEIAVYNVIGKNVLTSTKNELTTFNKLDLSNQPEGIYMVNINTNEGSVTKKITISRK